MTAQPKSQNNLLSFQSQVYKRGTRDSHFRRAESWEPEPDPSPSRGHFQYNEPMNHPTQAELDAKIATIEAKMDGRLARIEDRFVSMEKTMEQIGRTLEAQKNVPWKAAAATIAAMIATVIAVAAFGFSAFDSGRETAKLTAETQRHVDLTLQEMRQIVDELRSSQSQQISPPSPPSASQPGP